MSNNNCNLYSISLYYVPIGLVENLLSYFDFLCPEELEVSYSTISSLLMSEKTIPENCDYINMRVSFYSDAQYEVFNAFKEFMKNKVEDKTTERRFLNKCLEVRYDKCA